MRYHNEICKCVVFVQFLPRGTLRAVALCWWNMQYYSSGSGRLMNCSIISRYWTTVIVAVKRTEPITDLHDNSLHMPTFRECTGFWMLSCWMSWPQYLLFCEFLYPFNANPYFLVKRGILNPICFQFSVHHSIMQMWVNSTVSCGSASFAHS